MFDKQNLIKLASYRMPFGRFQGRVICDLPEEYLLWFNKKGFPDGELGMLLQLMLEIHINGASEVVRGLKHRLSQSAD